MAFDMYAGDRREAIHDHEEYIFSLMPEAPGTYPQLRNIQSRFYSDFALSPEDSGALVHELLSLHDHHGSQGGKSLAPLVLRLAQFFSMACQAKTTVRCSGD